MSSFIETVKKPISFLKKVGRFVNKLIYYSPVLWKDEDWDQSYIFSLLRAKLVRVEKCIREGYSANAEKEAKNIKTCILLLKRLENEEYMEQTEKYLEEKWGARSFSYKDDPSMCFLKLSREKVSLENEKQFIIDAKRQFQHESYRQLHDLKLLFKIMQKHIFSWWD